MARERMTQRHAADKALAEIDALKRRIIQAMGDEDIENWANKITNDELGNLADNVADEEREIAEESTGISTDSEGDQNEKSKENWPTSASTELADELSEEERVTLATELTKISKVMAKRIANGGLTQKDRVFVATRLLAAAKRISSENEEENEEDEN